MIERISKLTRKLTSLEISRLLILSKPPATEICDLNIRFVDVNQYRCLATQEKNNLKPELAGRLNSGNDRCLVASRDGQVVAHAWFAIDSIEAEHNHSGDPRSGVALEFPEDVAFLYNLHVQWTTRSDEVVDHLLSVAWNTLSVHSVRRILTSTDWLDHTRLQQFESAGFRKLGLVYRFGLPVWHMDSKVVTLATKLAKRMGISVGCNEKVPCRDGEVARFKVGPALAA